MRIVWTMSESVVMVTEPTAVAAIVRVMALRSEMTLVGSTVTIFPTLRRIVTDEAEVAFTKQARKISRSTVTAPAAVADTLFPTDLTTVTAPVAVIDLVNVIALRSVTTPVPVEETNFPTARLSVTAPAAVALTVLLNVVEPDGT